MKKHIFLLLIWASLLWILFLAIPDFYQHFYLKDLGLVLMEGIGFILPLPRGDENWFYGLFLIFTLMYLEALMIVSVIFFILKTAWQIIHYLCREFVKPKE